MERLILSPYDPRWPEQYAKEHVRIAHALGATARRIEHHGSTAVPGMAAKPVIDIQISVGALQTMERFRIPLEELGYIHVPNEDDVFCPFFHRPRAWPHAYHVHVVAFGGDEEARTLAFRDYLRDHADVALEYATLKSNLASQFSAGEFASRQAYADAKSEFINRITQLARACDYPRLD